MTSQERLTEDAREIFLAALRDCSVERAYDRKLRVVGTTVDLAGESVDLAGLRHLRVVAAGKAAAEMLMGFLERVPLAPGCELKGVLIGNRCPEDLPEGVRFFAGGHPIPNQASFDGARAALEVAREAAELRDVLCLFLISGGASAMMELPLADGVSLAETADFYRALVHRGATIAEINCVRKHFSAVKGGRLGLAAGGAPGLTVLVSDVPPEKLDSLASGPTMADTTTVAECLGVLDRYSLWEALPRSIREYFASGEMVETPKAGDLGGRAVVLLDSDDLAAAAGRAAAALGYRVVLDHACDDWAYDQAAEYLLGRLREMRTEHGRVCLLSAGEVTVTVPAGLEAGRTHVGGRNQHFALYCSTLLGDEGVAVLSAGSDGVDGNSGAAGAVVGWGLAEGAAEALREFDSSSFLARRGAVVVTGATGNNLRDLRILVAEPG